MVMRFVHYLLPLSRFSFTYLMLHVQAPNVDRTGLDGAVFV